MKFKCECGKEFENSQSFNGHKAGCRVHHLAKYGNLDLFNLRYSTVNKKAGKTRSKKAIKAKQDRLQQWLAEKHKCEHCGKVMTKKFGSGRFCSRACANARIHSDETIQKITKSVLKNLPEKEKRYCSICGKELYAIDNKHGLCADCLRHSDIGKKILHDMSSIACKGKCGGKRHGSGVGKHGWYQGYYCDSTYELVWTIYCLDHNIKFKRCRLVYEYYYKNKLYKYYPDYELSDGSLIEIKGYHNEVVDLKTASVKDRLIKVLYKKDLKEMFDYVKQNYQYKNLTDLYN